MIDLLVVRSQNQQLQSENHTDQNVDIPKNCFILAFLEQIHRPYYLQQLISTFEFLTRNLHFWFILHNNGF